MLDGVVAGSIAAVLSGAPSTLHALVTERDPLEATLAVGSMLLPDERRRGVLLVAAVPIHVGLSLAWGVALARVVRGPRAGALAGIAIHVVDFELIGRFFPRIRVLPRGPQLADHIAYGVVVGAVLARLR